MSEISVATFGSNKKVACLETELGTRPYTRLVSDMSASHPNLANLEELLAEPSEKGVAAVLNFRDAGVTEERFVHSIALLDHLNQPGQCDRRLIILQGVPSNFVEVLGWKFNIDPNFFARQIRSGMLHINESVRDIPLLASHPTSTESFCLRYHELRQFADPIYDWELRVADQARRVSVSKCNGEFDGVGIARKTSSVWFRAKQGNGWDGKPLL